MGSVDLIGGVRCAGCRRFGAPLCLPCRATMRPAEPVAVATPAGAVAAFAYEGAARSLVLGLKLGQIRPFAGPLADGMVAEIWRKGLAADVVTWVPGRRGDVLRRGFDHAAVLATGIARRTGLPMVRLLRRNRASRDQTSLTREQRLVNLAGVFESAPCGGLRVVLVDDLITTGATAMACLGALRAAGASSVEVLTACRA